MWLTDTFASASSSSAEATKAAWGRSWFGAHACASSYANARAHPTPRGRRAGDEAVLQRSRIRSHRPESRRCRADDDEVNEGARMLTRLAPRDQGTSTLFQQPPALPSAIIRHPRGRGRGAATAMGEPSVSVSVVVDAPRPGGGSEGAAGAGPSSRTTDAPLRDAQNEERPAQGGESGPRFLSTPSAIPARPRLRTRPVIPHHGSDATFARRRMLGSNTRLAASIRLVLNPPKKPKKSIKWSEDTVDNEHLGRRKSKSECRPSTAIDAIAHRPTQALAHARTSASPHPSRRVLHLPQEACVR